MLAVENAGEAADGMGTQMDKQRETLERLAPVLGSLPTPPADGRARIIALEGRAAAGKTTLAAALAEALAAYGGAGVVHMDDFFLPAELRTPERLAEPGGNVDYARFAREILPCLRGTAPFCYRRFDCGSMALGEARTVAAGRWRIVEGAYSAHPYFGPYADLLLFADVDPATQQARILQRNGPAQAAQFASRWIPLEEAYFSATGLPGRAARMV
ncbi:MAG: uridine kinase [Gemmiger sp.]|nr:uridine kinase [Gemmiger sp.]